MNDWYVVIQSKWLITYFVITWLNEVKLSLILINNGDKISCLDQLKITAFSLNRNKSFFGSKVILWWSSKIGTNVTKKQFAIDNDSQSTYGHIWLSSSNHARWENLLQLSQTLKKVIIACNLHCAYLNAQGWLFLNQSVLIYEARRLASSLPGR